MIFGPGSSPRYKLHLVGMSLVFSTYDSSLSFFVFCDSDTFKDSTGWSFCKMSLNMGLFNVFPFTEWEMDFSQEYYGSDVFSASHQGVHDVYMSYYWYVNFVYLVKMCCQSPQPSYLISPLYFVKCLVERCVEMVHMLFLIMLLSDDFSTIDGSCLPW